MQTQEFEDGTTLQTDDSPLQPGKTSFWITGPSPEFVAARVTTFCAGRAAKVSDRRQKGDGRWGVTGRIL